MDSIKEIYRQKGFCDGIDCDECYFYFTECGRSFCISPGFRAVDFSKKRYELCKKLLREVKIGRILGGNER